MNRQNASFAISVISLAAVSILAAISMFLTDELLLSFHFFQECYALQVSDKGIAIWIGCGDHPRGLDCPLPVIIVLSGSLLLFLIQRKRLRSNLQKSHGFEALPPAAKKTGSSEDNREYHNS
jgi:hypothetical protein